MEDQKGLEVVVDGQNKIIVKGIDKEKSASTLLKSEKRAPEPYKGKVNQIR